MSAKRIGSLDIAKCIAIAFIVIGHVGIVYSSAAFDGGVPRVVTRFAFTFHLPVFFVVSGYFFSESRGLSKDLLKKDAIGLLVPYLVTAALIVLGCAVVAHFHGLTIKGEIVRWGEAALWGAGSRSGVALWDVERIGGIWFLLAMFWAHILIASTRKLTEWSRLLLLSICTIAAAESAKYVWLPLSIQSGIGCAVFLYVGMLARKHNAFEKGRIPLLVMVAFLAAWAYVIKFGGSMALAMQIYPLGVIDVIGGLAATAVIVTFSRLIDEHIAPVSRFMQWIGRNTLVIFCMHILEDNMFYWGNIGAAFSAATGGWEGTWVLVCLFRFVIDAALVALMYAIPGIRRVYFPQFRKKKQRTSEAALTDSGN